MPDEEPYWGPGPMPEFAEEAADILNKVKAEIGKKEDEKKKTLDQITIRNLNVEIKVLEQRQEKLQELKDRLPYRPPRGPEEEAKQEKLTRVNPWVGSPDRTPFGSSSLGPVHHDRKPPEAEQTRPQKPPQSPEEIGQNIKDISDEVRRREGGGNPRRFTNMTTGRLKYEISKEKARKRMNKKRELEQWREDEHERIVSRYVPDISLPDSLQLHPAGKLYLKALEVRSPRSLPIFQHDIEHELRESIPYGDGRDEARFVTEGLARGKFIKVVESRVYLTERGREVASNIFFRPTFEHPGANWLPKDCDFNKLMEILKMPDCRRACLLKDPEEAADFRACALGNYHYVGECPRSPPQKLRWPKQEKMERHTNIVNKYIERLYTLGEDVYPDFGSPDTTQPDITCTSTKKVRIGRVGEAGGRIVPEWDLSSQIGFEAELNPKHTDDTRGNYVRNLAIGVYHLAYVPRMSDVPLLVNALGAGKKDQTGALHEAVEKNGRLTQDQKRHAHDLIDEYPPKCIDVLSLFEIEEGGPFYFYDSPILMLDYALHRLREEGKNYPTAFMVVVGGVSCEDRELFEAKKRERALHEKAVQDFHKRIAEYEPALQEGAVFEIRHVKGRKGDYYFIRRGRTYFGKILPEEVEWFKRRGMKVREMPARKKLKKKR